MDIRKHIKELLFTHDCVIIPGFGGFVTSYQSSEVQRFKNVVYPPSKSILFNRRLQTNDGVLISQVAQQEKIDYRAAEEKVRQSADAWNRLIDNKGLLMFPDIGKVYINSSNALVFLPELRKNYLMDTFGLKPIAYQLHTESTSTPSAKIVKMERKPTPPAEEDDDFVTEEPRKNRTGLVIGTIAAAIIILLLVPQMFLQNMLPPHMRIQQLNVLALFQADSTEVKVPEKKKELLPSAEENAMNSSGADTTQAENAEENSSEYTGSAETAEANASESNSSAESANSSRTRNESLPSSGNFYIVFGTSDFISDAIRQKKQLDEQHSRTFDVFAGEDGNYVVGIRAGETREQAEASLNQFGSSGDLRIVVREQP